MTPLAAALGAWLGAGLAALALRRRGWSGAIGLAGAWTGAAACAAAAWQALADEGTRTTWSAPWTLPGGSFQLLLDPVAGVFLLPLALVGALGAGYGVSYLKRAHHGAHAAAGPPRSLGAALGIYALLLGSMTLVVTANDVLLFLIAWEAMTLASWALVVSDHEDGAVRAAGLQYLIASHLATALLVFLLLALAHGSGTFEIAALDGRARFPSALLFLLAVVGFGTKAGIVPVHVWLPDAHPAAPSHVSALMSAVMVTMGFYGLARFLPILGAPSPWWGYLLLTLGAAGAVGGVLFALAQRDVKRVLAYSTVENAGLVTAAIGLALLGVALGRADLAGLGWTAALLHLWNHALAKGGLFLGFGAAAQAAGSRNLDDLGGLLARWPRFGTVLALLTAAIAAVPGLNVFTSEWLLLRGLLRGGTSEAGVAQVVLLGALVALAFAGGLAVACFVRLLGVALLGSPRSRGAGGAPEPGPALIVPVAAAAAGCVLAAAIPVTLGEALAPAVGIVAASADTRVVVATLAPLAIVLPLVAAALLVTLALRSLFRAGPRRERGATWGCGYPAPTAAMQYTSGSFGEPITRVLHPILATETHEQTLLGARGRAGWPVQMRRATRTADRALAVLYGPLFQWGARLGTSLRVRYKPRVSLSLLYIVITALLLLGLLFLPEAAR